MHENAARQTDSTPGRPLSHGSRYCQAEEMKPCYRAVVEFKPKPFSNY